MILTAEHFLAAGRRLLLARDPSAIVDHHIEEGARFYRRLLREVVRVLCGADQREWNREIERVLGEADHAELAADLLELRLRGIVLGADDSRLELELPEDKLDEPDTFARSPESLLLQDTPPKKRTPRFRVGTHLDPVMPWLDVLEEFLQRGSIERDLWDQIEQKERDQTFTVAYQSSRSMVEKIHQVVARGLGLGEATDDIVAEVQTAGEAITAAHAETVYRNAVQGAYARGRAEHASQPHVVALRPYWQVLSVLDQRTRPTHRAVRGYTMLASDPGWQATYPPFGHRCRCRTVCRSEKWVKEQAATLWTGALPDLPDYGWSTTPPPIVQAA